MIHSTFFGTDTPEKTYVPPCDDFSDFTSFVKDNRKLTDDNIILVLNKTDNSVGQCQPIWKQLQHVYAFRDKEIQRCVQHYQAKVDSSGTDPNRPPSAEFQDKKRLSFLKSELEVEDILRNQAVSQFKTRCQGFQPSFESTWASQHSFLQPQQQKQ